MLRNCKRPGNAVQMGSGSGQQFNHLLSPAHNMRHQSNAPGSGRVVCLSALQIYTCMATVSTLECCNICVYLNAGFTSMS